MQEVVGRSEVGAQRAQASGDVVLIDVEIERGGEILELALISRAVELARAFVEQIGGELRKTRLVVGIERRAAAKRDAGRNHRNAVVFDQPGGDPARALDLLDGDGTGLEGTEQRQRGHNQNKGDEARHWLHHEVGPGISTPVTAISSWMTRCAAAST